MRNSLTEHCTKKEEIKTLIFKGDKLRVAKVDFAGLNYENDISENDREGWLYREIKKQNKDTYVLSRYIALSSNKENNAFYVVFERSIKTAEEEKDFYRKVVDSEYQDDNSQEDENRAVNSWEMLLFWIIIEKRELFCSAVK